MGIASLDAALSGLRVSQQQISVISNNVANVATPGYSRKILPQSSQAIQGVTVGVRAETIIRNVDLNLERDLWTQVSSVGYLDVQESYLNRIQQFHGPPDQELSVAAELARLRDSFSSLADSPEDAFLQSAAVDQAIDTASKINDLSDLITTLRNDAQDEIETTIGRINDLLVQIADLNDQVQDNLNLSQTTALYEDERDSAIQELSELMEISFFQRGDGVLVVQTNRGVELASNIAQQLTFDARALSATTFYPDSIDGIFVGDPSLPSAVDITTLAPGGKLQGLIELRDEIFPKQMAQLDEMAHKLALRTQAQGLMLFTDGSGSIPADTAPDPTLVPETAVEYVGFSAVIQVNDNIIADNTLIKNGTYGAILPDGSNEVIRRVLEFAFSGIEFQQAENTDTATQVDLLNTGGVDLQNWLGLLSSNTMIGGRDLTTYATVGDIVTFANGALDNPNDQFEIIFEEPRIPLGPVTLTVDLSDADALGVGVNAAEQLVDYINNTLIPAALFPAGLNASASVGTNGELIIETNGSYEIDSNTLPTGMGDAGLVFFGLSDSAGVPVAPTDPYFDVQVGNNPPTRITLEPNDTVVELITKLQTVDGLAIDTDNLDALNVLADGVLRLRPGDDYINPDFGGDIKITGGPFDTLGAGYGAPPAATARLAMDDGVNITAALFGTYAVTGGSVIESSPINNMSYGSETDGSLAIPRPTISFREDFLGPGGNISTRISGSIALIDFAQKMVNEHSQQLILTQARKEDEVSLQEALQTQFLDDSGVNLDEELGNLIVVQTAYSASARVLTAVDELFQELLNAVR